MFRSVPALLAILALAGIATPALAKNDGLFGRKITICHVPPGKVVLDELGEVDWERSKVVKIRTGRSAQNGHELGGILGEHKAHQYDRIANADGTCREVAPEPEPEVVPE